MAAAKQTHHWGAQKGRGAEGTGITGSFDAWAVFERGGHKADGERRSTEKRERSYRRQAKSADAAVLNKTVAFPSRESEVTRSICWISISYGKTWRRCAPHW